MSSGEDREEGREPADVADRAGFWATVRAVLWSFFGVRRRADYHRDASSLDPRAVIVAGVLGGVLFVLAILGLVHVVVGLSQ